MTISRESLVVCESKDGWSLHAPGSSDEQIANGEAPALISGAWEIDGNGNRYIPSHAYDKAAALAAVEAAPWDESDSALSGADIWGTHGEFAAARASGFFTYRLAVQEVVRYEWAALDDCAGGDQEVSCLTCGDRLRYAGAMCDNGCDER